MSLQRVEGGNASIVEILDRVLDKGVVIDAWVSVSLVGIDLITVEARVVVASIATYIRTSDDLAQAAFAAKAPNALRGSRPIRSQVGSASQMSLASRGPHIPEKRVSTREAG